MTYPFILFFSLKNVRFSKIKINRWKSYNFIHSENNNNILKVHRKENMTLKEFSNQ